MLILQLKHAYTRCHCPSCIRAGCAIRREPPSVQVHRNRTYRCSDRVVPYRPSARHRNSQHRAHSFPNCVPGKPSIKNAAALKSQYNVIFNARVVKEIKKQVFNELFANSDGIMIGNGEVWFAGICNSDKCNHVRVRIVAINNI